MEIDRRVLVHWSEPSVADALYGEAPNCYVDPWETAPYILLYTNPTFLLDLSRQGWAFTVGHEVGHVLNGDPRYTFQRDRYREALADVRAAEICVQLGYDPVEGMRELHTRFGAWVRDSIYAEHPSAASAVAELAWRLDRLRRLMDTL